MFEHFKASHAYNQDLVKILRGHVSVARKTFNTIITSWGYTDYLLPSFMTDEEELKQQPDNMSDAMSDA